MLFGIDFTPSAGVMWAVLFVVLIVGFACRAALEEEDRIRREAREWEAAQERKARADLHPRSGKVENISWFEDAA